MEQPRTRPRLASLSDFPPEVLSAIFCKLPIESILTCKCVCKPWNGLIEDRQFARQHLLGESERATQLLVQPYWPDQDDDDEVDHHLCLVDVDGRLSRRIPVDDFNVKRVDLMGTCHGLVAVASTMFLDLVLVCNPVNRETVRLPILWSKVVPYNHRVGLGYDSSIQKYKVLRTYAEGSVRSFESATVGTNELWRKIETPYEDLGTSRVSRPVFWNGAIHWKVKPRNRPLEAPWILAYDIINETFQRIHLPQIMKFELVVVRGSLIVIEHQKEKMRVYEVKGERVGEFEVIFVEEHDTHVTWNMYHYYNVIDRSEDKESYLLEITACYGESADMREHFTQFLPKLANYSYRDITGLPRNFTTTANYRPSLISPTGIN
ncbi:F-box protein At5g49610-like [Punica granatum]|uniref:F-box domain-containing protein n=2 Tax=Punica granatum TaxID=22663 RepID=A0A218VZA7_PUNGR|nr:F-box protein At5g49610-like [Punica granatum]OWM65212.1 hypothetical protein CDL15_Pgr008801 [Punica granatum]PKI47709.1 hypothetical protein CRG98_031842 [Punica granatum]